MPLLYEPYYVRIDAVIVMLSVENSPPTEIKGILKYVMIHM